MLQAKLGDEWRALYRFDLTEQHAIDYELANHYVVTHPSSRFRAGIGLARTTPQGRHTLRNRSLAFRAKTGEAERSEISSASELLDVMRDVS